MSVFPSLNKNLRCQCKVRYVARILAMSVSSTSDGQTFLEAGPKKNLAGHNDLL